MGSVAFHYLSADLPTCANVHSISNFPIIPQCNLFPPQESPSKKTDDFQIGHFEKTGEAAPADEVAAPAEAGDSPPVPAPGTGEAAS